ncbi:hypothetical protein SAMN06298216_4214 [Spirosomataceae bacterium TFI 002]|nr:hypothetical protein SAMN06298216_4214 [Spirosomataceae bacterium TFI 002]
MKKQYHILNGDALKEQFPKTISGEIIVARECLVDGDIEGKDLLSFFQTRAKYIDKTYGDAAYFEKTVPEFEKMQNIQEGAEINLWFEDDLFCQVNLWFVINLLTKAGKKNSVYLVRPGSNSPYSFGVLSNSELIAVFENKQELSDFKLLASLWETYQNGDNEQMVKTAKLLKNSYPFIEPAVMAHIDRISDGDKPTETLMAIMNELNTREFGIVFQEFSKRAGIYGFGDLQVKKLMDQIP